MKNQFIGLFNMKKLLPILNWLPNYKKEYLKGDIIAGVTVAVILIPQSIAYALIAGLPPIYGLYSALIPQIVYAFFGSSRHVSVGPVAMDSLILTTGISTIALTGTTNYIEIAILLALMVGTIQFLMGVCKLGFIVNFLSKPVIVGFSSAVTLIIGLNQFRTLLGINFLQSDEIQVLIVDFYEKINNFNINTSIIGLLAVFFIIIFRKINKKIPNALIVTIFSILVMYFFKDNLTDVAIVKNIPSGLPSFNIPKINFSIIEKLAPVALTLVMIGYLEIISIGKTLEIKQNTYSIRPNQELLALGLSNIFGSFFKCYPSTSSFSRSAVNYESGAQTGIAAFVSAILVILTLFFLTPFFYFLPKAILSAIIIVSVFNLIQFREAKRLFTANRFDFWLLITTFFSTLILGIEYGILIGVILSIFIIIYRTSKPYVTELGKVPNANFYKNKNRFTETIIEDDILVFRFDAQLFYANASYFRYILSKMAQVKGEKLKLIVLDGESINRIDSTGVDMLKEQITYYKNNNIKFYFAAIKGPVRDSLFKGGLLEVTNIKNFYMRVNDAVSYYKTGNNENQKKFAQYIHHSYH